MATMMSLQAPPASSAMPPPPTPTPRKQSTTQPPSNPPSLSDASTPSTTDGTAEDDEDEADNTTEKKDVSAPGTDSIFTDQTLQSLAASEFGDDDSVPGDLEQKMFELQASGWRPPEETADSADDDDYNAVDMMSDDEEEQSSLRRREEQLLTAEERFNTANEQALARRLSLSSQGSNDSDVAYLEFNDNFLFNAETPWSQSFQHLHPDNLVDYGAVFHDASQVPGQETPLAHKTIPPESFAVERRVRVEDEVDASDTDSNTDSEPDQDLFPDLFVQQDQLDAGFRADIEADVHDLYMDDDSETGSCWDFDADEARILMMDHDEDDDDSDSDNSSAGSSGYESDDGDTTDEEEIELPPEKLKEAAEKAEAAATAAATAASNMRKVLRRNPRMSQPKHGRFIIDPYKPIMTVDCEVGKPDKIRIWPARKQSGQDKKFWDNAYILDSTNTSRVASRNTSPRMSIQLTPTDESDSNMASRQLSIDSANMMDIFDESGRLRPDQVIGPAEAFMPFMDFNASGMSMHDDDGFQDAFQVTSGGEEEDDPLSSFVDFGDSDGDDEMPDEADVLMSPSTQSFSMGPPQSGAFDLLAHLDRRRGVVGSFRRNQQIARHVGSLPSHPALRASASETNAMQTGRRAAANTPITPLRKKKMGKGVGARNSPIVTTSPMNRSPPLKRKGPVKGGFTR